MRDRLAASLPEIILAVLTLATGVGLLLYSEREPTISDSIGYIVAGQRFAAGHGVTFGDAHNLTAGPYFYLHAFRMVTDNTSDAIFGYPPGFPVLAGLGVLISGQPLAANYAVPVLATVSIPLVYWLGLLLGQDKWVGIWAAFSLSTTLAFWQFSTAAWSEIPSLVFLVGGVGAFVFSRQRTHSPKVAILASVVGGVLIGYSFFIRFTNLILVVPTLVLFDIYAARTALFKDWRRWYFFLVVGLFAAGVLLYNWINFGGPFNSIYSSLALGAYPWPYFSPTYAVGPSPVDGFSFYGAMATLWENYHLLLLLAPMGWFYMKPPNTIISVGIVISTLGLYSVYAFAPTELNARFLLPMFPFLSTAIAVGGVVLATKYLHRRWYWAVSAGVACVLLFPIPSQLKQLQLRNQENTLLVEQARSITAQTPPDSVWLSAGLNDLIAVYGDRSVLNYRRMLTADPVTREVDQDRFVACLVQTLDRLVASDTPVFVVVDPGWDMSTLLQAYFTLVPVAPRTESEVVKVTGLADRSGRTLPVCTR